MTRQNKPKTLDRKLNVPFELQFSAPKEVEGKHGLKWTEFPVTLNARGSGHINHWWFGRVIHDLSGMSIPAGGTIPIDHVHGDEALGVIEEFDTKDGLTLKGKFVSTQEGDTAWNIATKIAAGIPYQASIFFDDLEDGTPIDEQILKKDQSDTVNGQKFEGPGVIVRKWLLRGVATCLYGADPNTKTQVLKHQPISEEPTMDPKEQMKQFTEKFGAELASKYFTEGLDLGEATSKFNGVLQERLDAAHKLAAEKDAKIAELEKALSEAGGKEKELAAANAKNAELEKQFSEAKSKLEVFEKQYGGVPYSALEGGKGGSTGKPADPQREYANELKKANQADDEDEDEDDENKDKK